jgi:predicted lipid-binding transport protein (Tim44 family)
MILVGGLAAGLFIGLLLMMVKRFYGAYKASNQQ